MNARETFSPRKGCSIWRMRGDGKSSSSALTHRLRRSPLSQRARVIFFDDRFFNFNLPWISLLRQFPQNQIKNLLLKCADSTPKCDKWIILEEYLIRFILRKSFFLLDLRRIPWHPMLTGYIKKLVLQAGGQRFNSAILHQSGAIGVSFQEIVVVSFYALR